MKHQDLKRKLLNNKKFRKEYENSDMFFNISRSLKEARINKGWSQEKLAEKLGMQQEAIARFENPGNTIKYLKTLKKIAEVLEVKFIEPRFDVFSLNSLEHEAKIIMPIVSDYQAVVENKYTINNFN